MKYKVAVIILNWNGKSWLEKFLPNLVKYTSEDVGLIVADNCSSDDSVSYVKDNYPTVSTLELDKNYGFAEGYNRAIKATLANYCVLLNSDVEVTPGWLDPLVKFLDSDPESVACQPKIKNQKSPKEFEYAGAAGGFWDKYGYPFCRGRIADFLEKDNGQYDTLIYTGWASGACLAIRRDLYLLVGGLDKSFFAHMEEIDLCWRLGRMGYKVACVPSSEVYHVGGGTLGYQNFKKTFLNYRNNLATCYKNWTNWEIISRFPVRLLIDLGVVGSFLIKGEFKKTWTILMAYFFFFANLPRLHKERVKQNRIIRKNRISKSSIPYHKGMFLWGFVVLKLKKFNELYRS